MNTKHKLEKRLSSYWRMELANVIIVPVAMIFLAYSFDSPVGWLSLFTFIPTCGLLVIGGLYWRGKCEQLTGNKQALNRVLGHAHWTQFPLLILTVLACLLTGLAFFVSDIAISRGDLTVASIASSMAALEYVNYYHRQLQHFDHAADFKRLLNGRGFRPSQMSQDLKLWRKERRD